MNQIYLRALELGDLDRTYRWHNDRQLFRFMVEPYYFNSRSTEEERLRKKSAYSDKEVNLAICLSGSHQHIGIISLYRLDWVARNASLNLYIGERDQWEKGYESEAIRLIIQYAFVDLGLMRLNCRVLDENESLKRNLSDCGFVEEARLRKHAFKDGQFKDVTIFGLCASDLQQDKA